MNDACTEFEGRTGISVKLKCSQLTVRLAAGTELTLYRILQEALRNVEKHARARHISVGLTQSHAFVRLLIKDDGVGFDTNRPSSKRKGKGGLGLLGMRERASYVGGALKVKSSRLAGTEIEVRIPRVPRAMAAGRARDPL